MILQKPYLQSKVFDGKCKGITFTLLKIGIKIKSNR